MWGYDEITWFAHQSKEYRGEVAAVRLGLGPEDRPERLPPDAGQPDRQVARWTASDGTSPTPERGGPDRAGRRGGDPGRLGGRRGRAVAGGHLRSDRDCLSRLERGGRNAQGFSGIAIQSSQEGK